MQTNHFKKESSMRFKRLSGKAYAVFNSMHREVSIGVVTSFLLCLNFTSSAQNSNRESHENHVERELELEEVSVTASRVDMLLSRAAKMSTIIGKEEIANAPVASIQDLLYYAIGVDVRQRSGRGVQADISIRGGSFDQTAILLNGANVSNPQTGHYSFDIPINLSDIERIEIIHGPSSVIYGASAFSGGINIITKKQVDEKALLSLNVGSHKLLELAGKTGFETTHSSHQLSLGMNTSDGYIANSDYDIFNSLLQNRLKIADATVDFLLGYNKKKYGANTFYSPAYANQYDNTESILGSIRGETFGKLKFIPQLYWNRHLDCFQLFREGTADIPTWYKGHNYHQSDVYGFNINMQYTSDIGISSLGSEIRNEGIISSVLGKPMAVPDGKYTHSDNRTNISYFFEHNILLNKFTLSLAALANYNTSLGQNYDLYPSLNVNYRLASKAGLAVNIYASWSKATRMPTFTDLYYTGQTHEGNSDLLPEKTESFELGAKFRNPLFEGQVASFYTKGRDMIDWVKEKPEDLWASRNLTEINKMGIESSLRINLQQIFSNLPKQTNINLSYMQMYQKKQDNNMISNYALDYLRNKLLLQLNHQVYKALSVSWNFRWQNRAGSYTAYEYLEPASEVAYPVHSILDAKLMWKHKDIRLQMSVNNIFDKQYYDMGNIPQAGFWMSTGLSYTIQ